MDDQPNTQAEPAPAVAIVVPAKWLEPVVLEPGYGELLIQRWPVQVVDFYREAS
jgi:hypothetical protein